MSDNGYARQLAAALMGERAPQPDRRQGLAMYLMGGQPNADIGLRQALAFDPSVRAWRQQFTQQYGEPPNMNDPGYNYGLAVAAGARPSAYEHDQGLAHWPSSVTIPPMGDVSLKANDHPTSWMEGFMQRTGVDPHEADYETTIREYLAGGIPFGWRR